jgi:phage terminase small subunit
MESKRRFVPNPDLKLMDQVKETLRRVSQSTGIMPQGRRQLKHTNPGNDQTPTW